jgi:hypothetical protein
MAGPYPNSKVYEFAKHIVAWCVKRDPDVYTLWPDARVVRMDLLSTINGQAVPHKGLLAGLTEELDRDTDHRPQIQIPAETVMAPFRISVVSDDYFAIEAARRFGVRIVSSPTCSLFAVPRRWA